MKRYELAELIKRWERGDITPEQAIGQALLWLAALAETEKDGPLVKRISNSFMTPTSYSPLQ